MDIEHAMTCRKGGFVAIRYNNTFDSTAIVLTKMRREAEVELRVSPKSGETLNNKIANITTEAKIGVSDSGRGGNMDPMM